MTHLSLFSGVGGIDLAAHWAGFRTIQFVEREPFCQRVLAKNFPGIPIHDDVTTFNGTPFQGRVTLLSGGFPCQDVSSANRNGKGLDGERSGLYAEALRIAKECKPRTILLENVSQLLHRGIDRVLSDLEGMGYACRTIGLAGGTAGLTSPRERIWVVAHSDANKQSSRPFYDEAPVLPQLAEHLRRPVGALDVRGNDGVPGRVDRYRRKRLQALGNAVSPVQALPILTMIAKEINK